LHVPNNGYDQTTGCVHGDTQIVTWQYLQLELVEVVHNRVANGILLQCQLQALIKKA
jgi:hypothetical protein